MNTAPLSDGTLFATALERPATERAAFLDEACGSDGARRARLDALLQAHERGTDLLASPVARPATLRPQEEVAGEWIDRYKLLLKIGEGGCGVVFMAEQEEPVKRRVALKVIKAGMDTREVIARFEAERQALALMDHPGICKVLDAGATAAGRPYFVMELVRGVPITKYCDECELPMRARIELFMEVCHAVQHAHQKGIIHRDLKPSNILVTVHGNAAAPKVIDFGIAKATQGRLTEATLVTAFEQFLGTPAYMSPEQAEMSGLDIDTRSDVYSLGVLLFELLSGRPPFDPKSLMVASRDELRRIIREVEPPRPSNHLSTLADADRGVVARRRGTDPARLRLLLAGDLDWIVLRALEKNRARRYESPAALADDLARHLRDEPVVARPPGNLYRIGKFVRRHRVGVAAVSAVALALVAGTVVSIAQMIRARRAEQVAVASRTRAEGLLDFMLGDLRAEVRKVGKLDLLEKVGDQATAYFASLSPHELGGTALLQQARMLRQIGEVQFEKGRFTEAMASFTAALERANLLVTRKSGDGDLLFERGQAEYWIGYVHLKRGAVGAAQDWFTRYRDTGAALMTLDPRSQTWRAEFVSGLHNLAVLKSQRGEYDAARLDFLAKLEALRPMVAARPNDLELQYRMSDTESWLGTLAERRADYREAIRRFSAEARELGKILAVEPDTMRWRLERADSLALLAVVHLIIGEYSGARSFLAEAREIMNGLIAHDRANREWSLRSHHLQLREVELERAEGNFAGAAKLAESARIALEALAEMLPENQSVRRHLVHVARLEAQFHAEQGRTDAAGRMAKAVALSEALSPVAGTSELAALQCAATFAAAATFSARQGDRATARAYAERAMSFIAAEKSITDWRFADPLARALAVLGRGAESGAIINRLQGRGYRPITPWPEPNGVIVFVSEKSEPRNSSSP